MNVTGRPSSRHAPLPKTHINLTLATWWDRGHVVPVWRYFGVEPSHLPLLFLFIIFFISDAG
jgi:hypothetical protein